MPRRESLQQETQVLISLGTVNQRLNDVELPPSDYSNIEGTFPEFSGLQSRIWGKRTLSKFATAVKGIHQFWTPLGYAGGLYQFSGETDFGKWLTPISKFPNLTLPPAIPFDVSGYTLDDFGWSNGLNFGIGDTGATGANLPNDNNGGPAGQGTRCQYQLASTNYVAATYIKVGSSRNGTNNFSTPFYTQQFNSSSPTGGCPLYPTPILLQPLVRPASFNTIADDGVMPSVVDKRTNLAVTAPTGPCQHTGTSLDEQLSTQESKGSFDFTLLQSFYKTKTDVIVYVNLLRTIDGVTPITSISVPLSFDFADGGDFDDVPFSTWDYLPYTEATTFPYAGVGQRKQASVSIANLTVTYLDKVCQ